tara:strand:+ start:5611 stop:6234 length:624 start_codon:yes stop_codon:yes gene_type:complete
MFITAIVVHMIFGKKLILASNSSSRYKILKNAGLSINKTKPLCNEEAIKKKLLDKKINIKNIPKYLAKEKALSISENKPNSFVIGSDTIIIFQNQIINKAKNIKEAKKKLKKLSGRKHKIISAVSVCYKKKQIWHTQQQATVTIRKLSSGDINDYFKKTGTQILSSVGCYQAEKLGPQVIKSIKGDFFNVLGFPLFPFLLFLAKVQK